MDIVIDKFVEFAKTLPGLGLVIAAASIGYGYLKGDLGKLSPQETFVTALVCWTVYHLASRLDTVYDAFYKPENASGPWGFQSLQDARKRAAKAVFGPVDPHVVDYDTARRRRYVGDPPLKGLNAQCATIARSSKAWHDRIKPMIDVSKAARTLFVFGLLGSLLDGVPVLRHWSGLEAYRSKLGVLASPWVLLLLSFAAFVVYVVLRLAHNVRLYELVADHVEHLQFADAAAPAVFDVTIAKRKEASSLA